jgi:hypothetical protein
LLVLWTKQSAYSISHSPTRTENSTSQSETFVLSMLPSIPAATSWIWKIGSGSFHLEHWSSWSVLDQFSSACLILLHWQTCTIPSRLGLFGQEIQQVATPANSEVDAFLAETFTL